MSEQAFLNPATKGNESGVSVYSQDDEKFTGWSSLPRPQVVRVAFQEDSAPVVKIGCTADLVFTGTGDIRLFIPQAKAIRCEYVPGQTLYNFEVKESQWTNIRDSLSPRRSARVKPKEPITLEIVSAAGELSGEIEDLSETGVSVSLPMDSEVELLRPGIHVLRFQLPGEEEPTEFHACVRYRACGDEDSLRFGFEFDPKETPNFRDQRWRLARFVWTLNETPGE